MVTIAYHSGDVYANTPASTRSTFYGVSGTPHVRLDGDHSVVGGITNGTMYPTYRAYFDQHKTVPSPLEIELTCTYDSATRQGDLGI